MNEPANFPGSPWQVRLKNLANAPEPQAQPPPTRVSVVATQSSWLRRLRRRALPVNVPPAY